MTIFEWIRAGTERLSRAPIQCADPALHMQQILEHVLGISTTQLYLKWNEPLSGEDQKKVEAFLERRLSGEPFQYLVGHEYFWESKFVVGPGVFIPRRETEFLVERVLKELQGGTVKIAELGAGSGNIGLSVLLERPSWEWHAFELSEQAYAYANKNKEALLPGSSRYFLHQGDFFKKAGEQAPYHAIVTNPPYVRQDELGEVSLEVKKEPVLALDGGEQGMEILNRLIENAKEWLPRGGMFFTEIDPRQQELVKASLKQHAFTAVRVFRDYGDMPRVVVATRE